MDWDLGLRGKLEPVSGLSDNVSWLNNLTIPIAPLQTFAGIFREGLHETAVEVYILTRVANGSTF